MKRALLSALVLFTLIVAPVFPGMRSAKAEPDILSLLMSPPEKEPPKVDCESGTKCVPKYRLSDEINDGTTKDAIAWIEAANKAGATELLIEINTPGGSVPAGFELARAIEDSAAPVTCVVDGDAESMGFYILQSCDWRVMTMRSKLMAHEPAMGGMFSGRPNEWQAIANMMAAEREALAQHCHHRLNIPMSEYRAKTDGGQMWFMLFDEAFRINAVDATTHSVRSLQKQMRESKAVAKKQD